LDSTTNAATVMGRRHFEPLPPKRTIMKPGRKGLARLWYATLYSWSGIRAAFQNEAAFRQEVMLVLLMTPVSFLIATTLFEWLLLIMPLLLLLIIELLNSAIESVVDRIGAEPHDLSGRAKDMGSAAVLFSLVLIAVTWIPMIWRHLHA